LDKTKGISVAICGESSEGIIPLVKDLNQNSPWFWKFPGGRGEKGESPGQTAIREYAEETGLEVNESDLQKVFEEERRNDYFTLYYTRLPRVTGLQPRVIEGEKIQISTFTRQQIIAMGEEFFGPHLRVAKIAGIL